MRGTLQTKPQINACLLGAALVLVLAIGCKQAPAAPATESSTLPANPPTVAQTAAPPAPFLTPTPAPARSFSRRHIYFQTADTRADIAAAMIKARREHKKIILDFGGDWCGDCQVLDIYFHDSPNAELLAKHFVLVEVDIEQYDHNLDIAQKYGIPLQKGVPALAVLDASGKLLYSQADKEFEHMASMDPQSVTDFLNHWKS